MDRDAQRKRLIEGNRGITAFMKLLRQIAITDKRIREHMKALDHGGLGSDELSDMIVLDAETFYTVAHDAIKIAELFLAPNELSAFRGDRAYKTICKIRSNVVRHAYDKPDGNTYSGYGYGPAYGPILKAGSGLVDAQGYLQHFASFWSLLENHKILAPSSPSQPIVEDHFLQRFIGRKPV
jgi:hypothetical protein